MFTSSTMIPIFIFTYCVLSCAVSSLPTQVQVPSCLPISFPSYTCIILFPSQAITTTQNMKFSMKDFFRKCDQIRRKLRIWSHLLNKSLMENFIFFVQCAHNLHLPPKSFVHKLLSQVSFFRLHLFMHIPHFHSHRSNQSATCTTMLFTFVWDKVYKTYLVHSRIICITLTFNWVSFSFFEGP